MSEFLCECGKKARPTTVKIKMDNGLIDFSVEMKVCFYCWVDIQSAVVDGNFRKLLVSSPQADTPKDAASDEKVRLVMLDAIEYWEEDGTCLSYHVLDLLLLRLKNAGFKIMEQGETK